MEVTKFWLYTCQMVLCGHILRFADSAHFSCTMQASTVINGWCFWLIKTQQEQPDSHRLCWNNGGYLALIKDTTEMEAIDDFTNDESLRTVQKYIGYYVDSSTTAYPMTRLDGTTHQYYAPWSATPTYYGPYNCVILMYDVLLASRCDTYHYALCSNRTNTDPGNTPPTTTTTTTPVATTDATTTPVATTDATTNPVESTDATTTPVETTDATTNPVETTDATTNPVETTDATTNPVGTTDATTTPVATTDATTMTTETTGTIETNSPIYTVRDSTVVPTTSRGVVSTPDDCDCLGHCDMYVSLGPVNMTKELVLRLQNLTRILRIERKALSSSYRRKISAPDDRSSAKGVGCVGLVLMIFVFGGIVFGDIIPALKVLFTKYKSIKVL